MGMKQVSGAFDPDFRAVIKELRMYTQVMGIEIGDLSRRSGLSDYALRRWLGEVRQPDMINLRILAESLGYTIKVTLEPPQ